MTDRYVMIPLELAKKIADSLDRFCWGEYPVLFDESRLAELKELIYYEED